jgi:hypothetical protein
MRTPIRPARRKRARCGRPAAFARLCTVIVCAGVVLLASASAAGAGDPGPTPFEASGGLEAATYEEVRLYLEHAQQAAHNILVSSCGYSAQGFPIPVVFVWDRAGVGGGWEADPTKPTVMITASIHAGESCGTDALLILLRRIARGLEPQIVSHARLILVPVFNVDGFRDRSLAHRFTQNGPANGFGTRRNALNLDLNRDFCKLDSPEVGAIVRLFSQFQPDVYIDLHTDDGVGHQYDILYSAAVNPTFAGGRDRIVREELIPFINESMRRAGFLSHPIGYFRDRQAPAAGLFAYGLSPRTSTGYFETRHCIAILSEAYPYKPYRDRVHASLALVQSIAEFAARNRIGLTDAIARSRQAAMRWPEQPGAHAIALGCRADTAVARSIDWRGKAFTVIESEVTGSTYALYGSADTTYRVPFHDRLAPGALATVPRGYLILPAYRHIAQTLRDHGIPVHSLLEPYRAPVECFRLSAVDYSTQPYQGRFMMDVAGAWRQESMAIPAGSYWVPLDHPAGVSAMHLLEPECPDALLAWNTFGAISEHGIILETWALEENARRLLNDPGIRAEYEAALADSAFAASGSAKLEFFFRKTPFVEDRRNRYPVFRVLGPPPVLAP